jgi:hypothetical protein
MKANLKLLSVAALLSFGGVAFAQDDSSADAAAGYAPVVAESQAVVLRVPVDANGIENAAGAELRVSAEAIDSATAAVDAFQAGTPVAKETLFDANSDSSTSRYGYGGYNSYGCGWNTYSNYGYGSSYGGYSNYRPTYTYNYSNSWSYSYSNSYSSYSYGNRYNYYTYTPSYRYCGDSYASWGHRWY